MITRTKIEAGLANVLCTLNILLRDCEDCVFLVVICNRWDRTATVVIMEYVTTIMVMNVMLVTNTTIA